MRVRLRLPESNRRRSRRAGGMVLSVVAHAVLIGAALYGTKGIEAHPVDDIEVPLLVYHAPPPPPVPTLAPVAPSGARTAGAPTPAQPPLPPREGIAPGPVFELDPGPLDGIVPSMGVAPSDFGPGVTARALGTPDGSGIPSGSSALTELEVERAVVLLGEAPSPRYPETLRAAGVQGHVVARFVVDTLGRVEPRSVEFPEATHAQFAEAVRQVLPRLRFRPAEAGGRRVRQLVQQEFRFALRE